jgi:excinuclease UvrABC nuclease subunit
MRDFHLRFFQNRWPEGGPLNLLDDDSLCLIPGKPGAYVLGTSEGTNLLYPWGRSPIFYIGKAQDLRTRLSSHRRHILDASEDHDELYWWPRYQYGASFGCTVAWYSTRGRQTPSQLESTLINQFYEAYGSIPCANGAWPFHKPARGSRDD